MNYFIKCLNYLDQFRERIEVLSLDKDIHF